MTIFVTLSIPVRLLAVHTAIYGLAIWQPRYLAASARIQALNFPLGGHPGLCTPLYTGGKLFLHASPLGGGVNMEAAAPWWPTPLP